MCNFPGANSSPPLHSFTVHTGILELLQKWVWSHLEHYVFIDLCNQPILLALIRLYLPEEAEEWHYA